jgi:hypothetical protein
MALLPPELMRSLSLTQYKAFYKGVEAARALAGAGPAAAKVALSELLERSAYGATFAAHGITSVESRLAQVTSEGNMVFFLASAANHGDAADAASLAATDARLSSLPSLRSELPAVFWRSAVAARELVPPKPPPAPTPTPTPMCPSSVNIQGLDDIIPALVRHFKSQPKHVAAVVWLWSVRGVLGCWSRVVLGLGGLGATAYAAGSGSPKCRFRPEAVEAEAAR